MKLESRKSSVKELPRSVCPSKTVYDIGIRGESKAMRIAVSGSETSSHKSQTFFTTIYYVFHCLLDLAP